MTAYSDPVADDVVRQLMGALRRETPVKFAYLFGSRARKDAGPLSDVDVAVYVDKGHLSLGYRLKLAEKVAKTIRNDRVDVVLLNEAPPAVKHEIIKTGIVLKEDKPKRVVFETGVLREYLDTAYLRDVQRADLRERIRQGSYFG